MSLKLVFVPVWLERVLKGANMALSDALDAEKMARILSTQDVDLYNSSNYSLSQLIPAQLLGGFQWGDCDGYQAEAAIGSQALDDDAKRGYLYGEFAGAENASVTPEFTVTPVGGHTLVLTVSKEQTDPNGRIHNLMNSLLNQLNSVLPLNQLAATSVFKYWMEWRAFNRVPVPVT